jgi:nucleotide-binding universal stress UspA family protein
MGLKRQVEGFGVDCNTVCRHGFAGDIIREALGRTRATRIIVGTHGRGKLGQIALGSVTNDLLTSVNIPVFVVGPGARSAGRQSRPCRILHPVSFSGDYIESVRLALDLAQAYRAELVLLHVLDPDVRQSMNPARTISWAENALRALVPGSDDLIPAVHVSVTAGDLVKAILHAADETEADCIVVGATGAFPLFQFRDSAAYKVTATAHCPVLAIRHAPLRIGPAHEEDDRFAGISG